MGRKGKKLHFDIPMLYNDFFIKHILFPFDAYRSGRAAFFRYLDEYEKTQFLTSEEIREISWRRLTAILEHAYKNIPYYRQSFQQNGVEPKDIKTEEDLLRLPILEKRQLQEHLDELFVPNWPKHDLMLDQTGGSTGTPVRYYRSLDRDVSRQAATVRHNRWASWDYFDDSAAIWGAARDIVPSRKLLSRIRNSLMPKQYMFNTASFQEKDVLLFNKLLKQKRPKAILGYANSLVVFAKILEQHGVTAYTPASVIASAEILTPDSRNTIERIFGCPVFNRYGSRETSVIASECSQHSGLHVMAEGLYIELIRNGKHAKAGETGEIVVTDLLNLPMPLIRYRIGDTASWSDKKCPCGRGLPMLAELTGRVTDFLVTDSGGLCSGAALTALLVSKRPSLKQVQICQETKDSVLFRIASGANTPVSEDDMQYVREKSAVYLGKDTKVEFEFVDEIAKAASGKNVFSISKAVPKEFRFCD